MLPTSSFWYLPVLDYRVSMTSEHVKTFSNDFPYTTVFDVLKHICIFLKSTDD